MNYKRRDQFFRNYVNFKKAFLNYINTGLEGTQLYEVIVRVHIQGQVEQYTLTIRLFKSLPIFQNVPFRVQIRSKLLKYLRIMARRIDLNKTLQPQIGSDQACYRVPAARNLQFCSALKQLFSVLQAQGNQTPLNGMCQATDYVEIAIREKGFSQLIFSKESNILSQKYLRSLSNQSSHESFTAYTVDTKCQNEQFQSQPSQFQKQMEFQNRFMDQQLLLLGAVRRLLITELDSLSAPLQVKVLIKLREMFLVMREHAKYYRSAYAFQILLAQACTTSPYNRRLALS